MQSFLLENTRLGGEVRILKDGNANGVAGAKDLATCGRKDCWQDSRPQLSAVRCRTRNKPTPACLRQQPGARCGLVCQLTAFPPDCNAKAAGE